MNKLSLSISTLLFLIVNLVQAQSIDLTQLKACDILTVSELAELMGTTADQLVQEDMSFAEGKRRSICHYVLKGAVGSVNIRVATKSDKGQENKVLETSYQRYLTQGEQNISSYEELAVSNDSQILFGTNTDRSGTNHVIRRRFGNLGEVKIEVLKSATDEGLRDKLSSIVNSLK